MKRPTTSAVIMAAGTGSRMGAKTPKPYLKVSGKPVLYYSYKAFEFCRNIDSIYIVISASHKKAAAKFEKDFIKNKNKFKGFVIGGKERRDSVYNAIMKIRDTAKTDLVAVHDAARPFVSAKLIEELITNAFKHGASAPVINTVDTLKKCSEGMFISGHIPRNVAFAVQTPQVFDLKKLIASYEKIKNKNLFFTDDTEIYGKMYNKIKVIPGYRELFKITHKEDLMTAEEYLKRTKKWMSE